MISHESQALPDVALRQRREAEPGAAGLQRRDNLAGVVADEAEARVSGVLLNHCSTARRDARDEKA